MLRTYLKIYVCKIFVKDKYFLFTVEYLLLKFLWKFFEMKKGILTETTEEVVFETFKATSTRSGFIAQNYSFIDIKQTAP